MPKPKEYISTALFNFHQNNPHLTHNPKSDIKIIDRYGHESGFFPDFYCPKTNTFIVYTKYRLNRFESWLEADNSLIRKLEYCTNDTQRFFAKYYSFNFLHSYTYHGLISKHLGQLGINCKIVFSNDCRLTDKPRHTCDIHYLSLKNLEWCYESDFKS